MMERTVITVPQKTAPSTPAMAKAIPARAPWTIPMSTVPFKVARLTEVNFSTIRISSS